MATIMARILKNFVPGSPAFFLAGLVFGLAPLLVRRTLSRWQSVWLSCLVGTYLVLSIPLTARAVAEGLYRHASVNRVDEAGGASTIVVFDGDHPGLRLKETTRLYALLNPQWVIVSSGRPWFEHDLRLAGIPSDRIVREASSLTTRGQAIAVAALLKARRIDRVVLVASPIHMPRALGACEAVGVRAVPSVTALPHTDMPGGMWSVIPRRDALFYTNESLYEYLAIWWYRRQGWLRGHAARGPVCRTPVDLVWRPWTIPPYE
jgi:uncharacterized SAM-binding protein YcdF (DUF218 family)